MENYRYLLSLPSELAKLKAELIEQQNELSAIIERNNSFSTTRLETALHEIQNESNTLNQPTLISTDEPLSIPEGKETTDSQGRIVIEVVSPPTFNLKKKKEVKQDRTHSPKPIKQKHRQQQQQQQQEPSGTPTTENGPLVYEFQKQENGELKVITTRDPTIQPAPPLIPTAVDILQRPPTRSHGSSSSSSHVTSRKEKKKSSRKAQTCPVCCVNLPQLTGDEFHAHVDGHFDEDESDFFELVNRVD